MIKIKQIISAILACTALLAYPAYAAEKETNVTTETDGLMERIPPKVSDKIRKPKTSGYTDPLADVSAEAAYNWYCRHQKNGEIPPCPPEMNFISECGGVYIGDTSDKVIYLTFDAGYENGNIAKILDTMKEKEVTGAFFVLENIAKQNSDLLRRMADEGHLICNHTAKHKDMTTVTDENAFKAELDALNTVCRDAAGVECAPFYRPPEGRFSRSNLETAKKLGYTTVFWSFAYADWDNNSQPSPDSAKRKILEGTHNGMVLLLHPTSATNAAILGDLIDTWKNEGYRFGTLDELCAN